MEREERLIGWIEADSGTVAIGEPVKMNRPDWETLVTEFLGRDNVIHGTTRTRLVRTSIVPTPRRAALGPPVVVNDRF